MDLQKLIFSSLWVGVSQISGMLWQEIPQATDTT